MDTPRFAGFGPAVTDWFVALDSDNSRAYWAATRHVWQSDVRGPLEALLAELNEGVGGRVKLFRPQRDLRFARDAAPLKTGCGGLIFDPSGSPAARYLEVSIRGLYAGTGYHQFARDQLAAYRRAAQAEAGDTLADALEGVRSLGLEVGGEVLRGAPRGVPRDHPRLDLLRRKGVFVGARLPPGEALQTRAAVEHARHVWTAAAPLVAWLDAHVGRSELGEEELFGRGRRRR